MKIRYISYMSLKVQTEIFYKCLRARTYKIYTCHRASYTREGTEVHIFYVRHIDETVKLKLVVEVETKYDIRVT